MFSYHTKFTGKLDVGCVDFSHLPIKDFVNIANNSVLPPIPYHGSMSSSQILHDKFYFSSLRTNLLSINHLATNHLRVIFSSSQCLIQDQRTRRIVGWLGKLL